MFGLTRAQIVDAQPVRTQDAVIQRSGAVMGAARAIRKAAGESKAQIGDVGFAGLVNKPRQIDADPVHHLDMVGGFFQGFADTGVSQCFARLEMPGGLVQANAGHGLLFHEQEPSLMLDHGRDRDIGFPLSHG